MNSEQFSDEDISKFCKLADSKSLAAHVVVYRLLHINKELAVSCMNELSNREAKGDTFDYNSFINEKLAQMPAPMDKEKRLFLERLMTTDLRKF